MNEVTIIQKVGLAVLKDGKILMTRDDKNDKVFYFVGGSIEIGETGEEAIRRETREELGTDIVEDSLQFLHAFEDWAHGKENTRVRIQLYQGALTDEPKPSSEVVELQYFDSAVDPNRLSAIAVNHIFPWLKKNGYIS